MYILSVKKRVFFSISVMLILLSASALAEDETDKQGFSFNLYNEQDRPLNNVMVKIYFEQTGSDIITRFTEYLSDNLAYVELEKGTYKITVFADNLTTEGKDYYLQKTMELSQDVVVLNLLPVGTIQGMVVDQLDNVVDNAVLYFHCGDYGAIGPNSSDELGFFIYHYAAIGRCRITAGYAGAVGSADVTVRKGMISGVELRLNKTLVNIQNLNEPIRPLAYVFLVLVVVIFIALIYFIVGRPKKRSQQEPEPVAEQKEPESGPKKQESGGFELSDNAKNIIKTLDEAENEIIKAIMQENGKTTQSKVYYETGIARTTLYRYIERLEAKNILKVKKIGKVKKIEFTDFFLGKEEKGD